MFANAKFVSYIFCFISLIYLSIGFFTVLWNYKKAINRVFFELSILMSFWAFCFSISTVASSLASALFINKLSAIGWCFSYPMFYLLSVYLLHENISYSKKIYNIIFLPSLLFLIFYLFFANNFHYGLSFGNWGWIKNPDKSISGFLFNIYALAYSYLCILNFYKWKLKSKNKSKSSIWTAMLIASFILGAFIDIILVKFIRLEIPQMSVICMIVPYFLFFINMKKNRMFYMVFKNDAKQNIDTSSKVSIFRLLGYFYLICAYWYFAVSYIGFRQNFLITILMYMAILLIGILHFLLNKIIKNLKYQYMFLTFIAIIMVVMISFMYRETLAITSWALFFIYLFLSIVFEDAIYGYIVAAFFVLVQIYWIIVSPVKYIQFDYWDYFGRITIVIICSFLVFRIHKAYRKKIKDNILQFELQDAVNHITETMIDLNLENISEKIESTLKFSNKRFDLINSYYCVIEKENNHVYACSNDEVKYSDSLDESILAISQDWQNDLMNGKTIKIFDISYDRELYKKYGEYFESKNISGFYAVPAFLANEIRGFVIFEFKTNPKNQQLNFYIDTLKNILSDTINKLDKEREIYKKAHFDEVTGLSNKVYFQCLFKENISPNIKKTYYFINIDIDNFKVINDTFGYKVGDKVLSKFGEILSIRNKEGLLARVNGDEFLILYHEGLSGDKIENYVMDLISIFKDGIKIDDNMFRLNVSVGIARFPEDSTEFDELLKYSDLAKNKSKKLAHKKYHFYNAEDKNEISVNLSMRDKLYDILNRDELRLAYQPQHLSKEGKIVGAEALLRWNSPDFGMVPPYKFIPILEKTGLIIEVGEWIIEEAMKECKRIISLGLEPLRISINLSVVQFLDTSLIDKIRDLKNKYEIDPKYIEFEITEGVAITDGNFIRDSFEKIKEMGFLIAIDDFGTAFSSLNRLQELPIDMLKIDKSFIDGISLDEKKEAIIEIIIELAKKLKLSSIAEGVEESYQLEFLKEHSCDEIQGYYFAKPMFVDEFEEYISKN